VIALEQFGREHPLAALRHPQFQRPHPIDQQAQLATAIAKHVGVRSRGSAPIASVISTSRVTCTIAATSGGGKSAADHGNAFTSLIRPNLALGQGAHFSTGSESSNTSRHAMTTPPLGRFADLSANRPIQKKDEPYRSTAKASSTASVTLREPRSDQSFLRWCFRQRGTPGMYCRGFGSGTALMKRRRRTNNSDI